MSPDCLLSSYYNSNLTGAGDVGTRDIFYVSKIWTSSFLYKGLCQCVMYRYLPLSPPLPLTVYIVIKIFLGWSCQIPQYAESHSVVIANIEHYQGPPGPPQTSSPEESCCYCWVRLSWYLTGYCSAELHSPTTCNTFRPEHRRGRSQELLTSCRCWKS